MPPRESYVNRVYTTSVVGYPELQHIGEEKDFSPIIKQAIALGGYTEDQHFTGINGGETVTTGFARNAVLSVAGQVIDGVKLRRHPAFLLSRRMRRRARRAGITTPSL